MRYRFGEYVAGWFAAPAACDDAIIHLSPKAFELLSLHVNRAPDVLSKEEIVQVVWPRVHVSDASLTSVVTEIRGALGDNARRPIFIRTVHGFEYAFSGEPSAERSGRGTGVALRLRRPKIPALPRRESARTRADRDRAIDHAAVSRRHARVSVGATDAVIEDLQSRNGTFVGDVIGIGPVTIVVEGCRTGGSTETSLRAASG